MQIEPIRTPYAIASQSRAGSPYWPIGSIVGAVATRDPATGQLWLNLGTHQLRARIASGDPDGPAEGELLQLRVLRNSPVLAFETLESQSTSPGTAAGDALRRMLPRQASPALLLANLAWLADGEDRMRRLPQRVADSISRVWQGLPSSTQLTEAAGLAGAIGRSGVFLESQLAQSLPGSTLNSLRTQDLKALLLDLRETLEAHGGRGSGQQRSEPEVPAPLPMLRGSLLPLSGSAASLPTTGTPAAVLDTLTQETDGALARLTATQLINTAAGGLAWLIELPVRHETDARMLRFRFEREPAHPAEEQSSWTIEAALELGRGEALHARIALRARRISVQLRSDSPTVVAQLKASSAVLAAALRTAGLNVDQLVCLHGLPVGDPGLSRAQLVDVHA